MKDTSKPQLQRRLFNEKDFKAASRTDRIMMHMLNPDHFHLNWQDENYRDYMIQCFQVCCENYRQAIIIRLMKEIIPTFSHASIVQLIADTQAVFGNITKRNHYFDLTIQRERILATMELVGGKKTAPNPITGEIQEYDPDVKDFEALVKYEKLLFEIDCKLAELEPIQRSVTPEMPRVMFSSDPSLLAGMANQMMEDGGEEE